MNGRAFSVAAAVVLLAGCHASSSVAHLSRTGASVTARSEDGSGTTAASVSASTPTTATHEGHQATYIGPLTAPYRQPHYGITLVPPPPGATARHSWQAAFTACFGGPVRCVPTGNADVTLATVTGPAFAGHLMFDHELAYVVVWGPSNCIASSAQTCRDAYLVSDKTATVVYGFDTPSSAGFPH